ncbi:MAG: 2Fe-2S iron-sulfur cluster binding domain-containing protein [Streptosporangiales bacterium]|nr:2Fe-2S iron-sulfur cluster binding domain-containing protein [Streptosporangiales bacterium]
MKTRITFTLNGAECEAWVFPYETALDVLREEFGAGEVRYGCGEGVCGTCTVQLDGEVVNGCLLLAVRLDGRDVRTVRGLRSLPSAPAGEPGSELHPLQESFLRNGAAQCGFCTPGMLLAAEELLREEPRPDRDTIRGRLAGNLCRCTGYTKILDAIEAYAGERAES